MRAAGGEERRRARGRGEKEGKGRGEAVGGWSQAHLSKKLARDEDQGCACHEAFADSAVP